MKRMISFLTAIMLSCFPIATNVVTDTTISSVSASSDASKYFNADHVTGIDYDNGTLFVGETTSARIYNANTNMCHGLGKVEVDPDIMTYTYDESTETVTFTAVGPGLADIWIYEATCGVGANYQVLVIEREKDSSITTTTAVTTTIESTDNVEETTSGDVVTTMTKVALNNLPSELTLKSGEEVSVDFTAIYISSVEAISSDINTVSTEVEFEQKSMFANDGKLILTAGSTPDTKTIEITVKYEAMIQGYDGSKTIKVTVLGNNSTTTTTTTESTDTETTTSYIRSTPMGGISADSIPDEVTIQSGETLNLYFYGMYIVGVNAVSSDKKIVSAEAALDEKSSMFSSAGTITISAGKTDKTKTAEVEFFYDTFIAQDGGSKVIKVTVAGEKDEPVDSTDQSFVNELFADFKAGAKNALSLRHYLAQDITFTSDCEYLTFVRSGYNEPGVVQYDAAPNVIVIGDSNLYSPNSATMYVYVDENAPTGKATVNMSYTSLSTGKEVKKSFDVDILSKEDAALTTTTTLPYTTTTTTTTVEYDYVPIVEYDKTPMKIGETRTVKVYGSDKTIKGSIRSMDFNPDYLICDYKEGADTFTMTAVAPVKHTNIWIYETSCSFSGEVGITILDEQYVPSKTAGDANCDDQVNMADAVFIMQCIANPDKYTFTEQGRKNADADKSGDITNMDALTIQRFKLKLIDSLT